jgi:hypothetical protein
MTACAIHAMSKVTVDTTDRQLTHSLLLPIITLQVIIRSDKDG